MNMDEVDEVDLVDLVDGHWTNMRNCSKHSWNSGNNKQVLNFI